MVKNLGIDLYYNTLFPNKGQQIAAFDYQTFNVRRSQGLNTKKALPASSSNEYIINTMNN